MADNSPVQNMSMLAVSSLLGRVVLLAHIPRGLDKTLLARMEKKTHIATTEAGVSLNWLGQSCRKSNL